MTEKEILNAETNLEFIAEVKEVKSKKLVSNDVYYRVILETEDPKAVALAFLRGDKTIKVRISEDG